MKLNKRKKLLYKRWVLIAGVAIATLGTTAAFAATRPDKPTIQKSTTPQQEIILERQPEATQTTSETPTAQQEVPIESPPTVDDLKALARQTITADSNEQQANCFEEAIELRYGWTNVTQLFVQDKITELNEKYVAMCPALDTLKKRGTNAAGFQD